MHYSHTQAVSMHFKMPHVYTENSKILSIQSIYMAFGFLRRDTLMKKFSEPLIYAIEIIGEKMEPFDQTYLLRWQNKKML